MRKNWTRTELILAMNLYCKLPFGKFDKVNSQVIELSNILERTPSAVAMKLSNLASLDPFHAERGVKGLSGASKGDRAVWQEFHSDWKTLAAESEILLSQMISNKDEADSTTQKVYEGETESLHLPK